MAVSQDELYFLIVNYYSTELIQRLLASIFLPQSAEVHFVIVNNSPDDTSIYKLTEKYPNLLIIEAEKNLGFGCGCNLGIQKIFIQNPQAFIWLINPDTTLENQAIEYVIQCFQKYPDVAILGTQIRDTQGNIWFSQGYFNRWTGSLKHTQANLISKSDKTIEVLPSRWVSGCSLILNLAKFETCPQFDPHYFLYYEDNELCERYHQQGYIIGVTQAVLVNHLISATSQNNLSAKFRHATYSKLYFLRTYGSRLALILNISYMFVKVVGLLGRDRAIAIGRWQGLKQFLFSRQHGE